MWTWCPSDPAACRVRAAPVVTPPLDTAITTATTTTKAPPPAALSAGSSTCGRSMANVRTLGRRSGAASAPPRTPPPRPGRRAARAGSGSPRRSACGCSSSPARPLELLAHLPDEHVHGAVAVGHRVAPDGLVDLLALEHLPAAWASSCSSSNSRRVRSTLRLRTNAWNWSARISSSPATSGPVSTRSDARLRRRTTASTRASTSSGWQGLVIQSSAPARRPRTRCETLVRPGAHDHAHARQRGADALEELPAPGPSSAEIDDQGVHPHRHELLDRRRGLEAAVLPAEVAGTLHQHSHEPRIRVEDRDSQIRHLPEV